MRHFICSVVLTAIVSTCCYGASISERVQSAANLGQYTYVMFYRKNDQNTQQMAKTVQSQVAKAPSLATWVTVDVNQPSSANLIKRFDATRIPLPAVFSLAPNGAVTGFFQMKVAPEQLETSLLTPKHAEMVKALQAQKIVVVCMLPVTGGTVPKSVEQFESSADFRGKTHRITAAAHETAEVGFFNRMNVRSDISAPVTMMFAPPGVHLGTFDANVTAQAMATQVHRSGKCNCEKCQHPKR